MARVPYLERDHVSAEVQGAYDILTSALGRVLNSFKVLAHVPKAVTGLVGLGSALRGTRLDPKLRELAYLKTSQVNNCRY